VSPAALPLEIAVCRGRLVESSHVVHAVVADDEGRVIAAYGEARRPTFVRSAVKAIQALGLVESGAADRFAFDAADLALACSSHSGTPLHVATARRMLAAAGLDEGSLECGAHWPLHDASARELARAGGEPCALHNNCSGKHAGFLAVARHLQVPLAGYVRADHPVQQLVAATLADMTGVPLPAAAAAIDGCSAPTFAVPLDRLATAFARFGTGRALSSGRAAAAARLRAAVAARPFLVAGPCRFDTVMTEGFGTRLFVKSGAEGVVCAAIPEAGLGIAVKAEDGALRASEAALAGLLLAHVPNLSVEERSLMGSLHHQTLTNWREMVVGSVGTGPITRP
jgi:L-asparaginase II